MNKRYANSTRKENVTYEFLIPDDELKDRGSRPLRSFKNVLKFSIILVDFQKGYNALQIASQTGSIKVVRKLVELDFAKCSVDKVNKLEVMLFLIALLKPLKTSVGREAE